ncbi:epidermal growth factor receptor substrate 15-like 1 isoform X2 [Photinus pyralis]|uniref:Epidermal growth factor receptor substrate 15-like 1 n=1 Tax=Photinus pyralis TaxID=7054 RepID=A0A1Y1L030_PHOPY|nr:epidermal growth factor receptor substrate 15-like 1 isoform X2 [Photinus pyralis]
MERELANRRFSTVFEKMAALPSPTQVAGNNSAIYESYYNFVDPNGFGTVGAMEAARFLKRSGLSDVVLSRVWDLSDPGGRGCLDKAGMFVALKLVALAQAGRDINLSNIMLDMPPPKMGDIPLPKPVKPPPPSNTPLISSVPPTAGVDWTIKPTEREKYDKLFDSLRPMNGLIPGNKVKGVLMDSKLPMDTLGKIWDLADQDKDGMLDRHEFVVAMHLVYKALEKHAIPNILPTELMPPPKRKESVSMTTPIIPRGIDGIKPEVPPPPPNIEPIVPPSRPPPMPSTTASAPVIPWVVTPDEKAISDALFIKSDIDRDGFVSGQEIKDVFLQSGVPQAILAHIWALCDIKQSGKLNNEQFALAMWFVARCLKGMDPPIALTPEMVPPSFRSSKQCDVLENNNTPYSNPELDMISKDIEELSREKLALEADITQKEADIKIKSGEIKSLQSELDTLAATLKQLENQKGEAQKRLNDLKLQVDKLRTQATEQAEAVATQESELSSKKQQLEGLRQEEQRLEDQKNEHVKKLDSLATKLSDTQLNISQAKAMITQLEEQTRQMNDAITTCDSAIDASDVVTVPDTALRLEPEFRDSKYNKIGLVNGDTSQQNGFEEKHDPFNERSNSTTTFSTFQDDPFKSDPFKNQDAFSINDSFNAAFTKTDGFSSDPFNSFNAPAKTDPFVAFGEEGESNVQNTENSKDPFGCDPFAILHAPTRDSAPPPRPTSPSPALPPKKGKQPPPRPAPPRPAPPGAKQQADDFGSSDPFSSSGGGGFANFADFDSKFSDKPTTTSNTSSTNKTLDFTDDPFRDYRYEDPFNIAFDDEPSDIGKSTSSLDARSVSTSNISKPLESKFDPFGTEQLDGRSSRGESSGLSGRQSAPLATSDAFLNSSGRASAPLNRFSEKDQVAWATKESKKNEDLRKQRLIQEQADLELAIALSKAEQQKN